MTNNFLITDAEREQLIGSVALIGPSGSGKTMGSLYLAKGMIDAKYPDLSEAEKWKKVGVIDTEHKRSKIYANTSRNDQPIGSFRHLDFQKPFTVDRLDQAMRALKQSYGVEIIIIDSATHFWEGEDGLKDLQQKLGGTFQAWREVNPHYNRFIELVTGEKHELDVISCIRAKQSYQVSQSETGKLQVEKLGLKPEQRDSLEYEFQIVLSVDMNHNVATLKDNSGIFEGRTTTLVPEYGEQIHGWLKEGVDPIAAERAAREEAEQRRKEEEEAKEAHLDVIFAYYEAEPTIKEYVDMVEKDLKKKGYKRGLETLKVDQLEKFVVTVQEKANALKEEKEHEPTG